MEQENIFIAERCAILEILGVKNDTLKTIIRKKTIRNKTKRKGIFIIGNF